MPEGKTQDFIHFSQFMIFTEMCQLDVKLCQDRGATVNNPDLIRAHRARAAEPGPTQRGGLGGRRPEELPPPGALSRNQASHKPADTRQTGSVHRAMAKIKVPSFQHDSAYWLPLATKYPLSRAFLTWPRECPLHVDVPSQTTSPPWWHAPGLVTAGARGATGLGSPGQGSGCPTADEAAPPPRSSSLARPPSLPPGLRANGPCLRASVGRHSAKRCSLRRTGVPPAVPQLPDHISTAARGSLSGCLRNASKLKHTPLPLES